MKQSYARLRALVPLAGGVTAILALPSAASAQVSVRTGVIASVFLSDGTNEAFRIALRQGDTDPLSDCRADFAYVNTSHNNYQAYVATLLTLYARNTPVRLETVTDASGFCQIVEFGT